MVNAKKMPDFFPQGKLLENLHVDATTTKQTSLAEKNPSDTPTFAFCGRSFPTFYSGVSAVNWACLQWLNWH